MNTLLESPSAFSELARRQLAADDSALLLCHWRRVVMIHFEVDAEIFQPQIPFPLDTRDAKAYVSAVAFTMTDFRPRYGGKLGALCSAPVASHNFLNVRTYVRHGDERGIYFLAEWLTNRLCAFLGPRIYGLPYRHGVASYRHNPEFNKWNGEMIAREGQRFAYSATALTTDTPTVAETGSLEEFLLERYTAFTERNGARRFFRVWHQPWRYIPLRVNIEDDSLLASTGNWFSHASFIGAHHCFDARNVQMSRPHKIVVGCNMSGARGSGVPAANGRANIAARTPLPQELNAAAVWLPGVALLAVALASQQFFPAWAFMWTLAAAMFFGLKWLTLRHALQQVPTQKPSHVLAYLFCWTGMNAEEFLAAPRRCTAPTPICEWLAATAKTLFGITPLLSTTQPLLVAWTGMIGLIFLLHFGAFHLLSLVWRSFGFPATPIMRNPIAATSLSDFWSNRWNIAFRDAAHVLVFRPLRSRLGAQGAMFAVFLVSGLLHDLVISIPAGARFGLPTLYFVTQGCGVWLERSALGKSLGLQRGIRGRIFALAVVAAPVYWLFHPPFAERVILPFLEVIGAWKGAQ